MVPLVAMATPLDRDPPPRGGAIKGAAFQAAIAWFAEQHGQAELSRRWTFLPEEVRARFDPTRPEFGLLPSTWYPAQDVHRVADVLTAEMTPAELEAFGLEAGKATMARLGGGVQRAIFGVLMNPERYARYVDRFWAANFKGAAKLRVEFVGERHHRGEIREWPEHHPLICAIIRGGKPIIYEAMGCRGAVCEKISCVSEGADACVSDVRWPAPE